MQAISFTLIVFHCRTTLWIMMSARSTFLRTVRNVSISQMLAWNSSHQIMYVTALIYCFTFCHLNNPYPLFLKEYVTSPPSFFYHDTAILPNLPWYTLVCICCCYSRRIFCLPRLFLRRTWNVPDWSSDHTCGFSSNWFGLFPDLFHFFFVITNVLSILHRSKISSEHGISSLVMTGTLMSLSSIMPLYLNRTGDSSQRRMMAYLSWSSSSFGTHV